MAIKPWERQPKESEEAYAAFLAYRDMGPGRTLEGAGKLLEKSWKHFGHYSSRWRWVERCEAWDNHLQRERDRVAVAEARKWERRRQQHVEAVWEDAQKLREKAGAMLAFPIARKESEDGRTVIHPAKWSFAVAAQILKFAAEMEAAALTATARDPSEMTDAEAGATAGEPGEG